MIRYGSCGNEGVAKSPDDFIAEPLRLSKVPGRAYSTRRQAFGCGFSPMLRITLACVFMVTSSRVELSAQENPAPFLLVLGVAQDGGYPQAGCQKRCCERAWRDPTLARNVVSLGLVDPADGSRWLIECTPDFKSQLKQLDEIAPPTSGLGLKGIFLTHAHIGHYGGLTNLGREVLNAGQIPVYTMPRMNQFLRDNGPWKLLVELRNIELRAVLADQPVELSPRLQITAITVPHRDEFSETVAFRIKGPNRSVLFLPDIDKWDRWERKVEEELSKVDLAYLDATFFDSAELPGRDMREIPHPFAIESIQRFSGLPAEVKAKIRFIHFNHSNPLLDPSSAAVRQIQSAGLGIAQQAEKVGL